MLRRIKQYHLKPKLNSNRYRRKNFPCGRNVDIPKIKGLRFHVTPCFIWWSWRELNPRPKFLHPRYYMLSLSLISLTHCGQTRHE